MGVAAGSASPVPGHRLRGSATFPRNGGRRGHVGAWRWGSAGILLGSVGWDGGGRKGSSRFRCGRLGDENQVTRFWFLSSCSTLLAHRVLPRSGGTVTVICFPRCVWWWCFLFHASVYTETCPAFASPHPLLNYLHKRKLFPGVERRRGWVCVCLNGGVRGAGGSSGYNLKPCTYTAKSLVEGVRFLVCFQKPWCISLSE